MSADTIGLIRQGITITVLGMGLVFAGLGILWGMLALMGRFQWVSRSAPAHREVLAPASPHLPESAYRSEALTAERARVAAAVAGAMLSNALPIRFDVSPGPAFEHGRTAPLWVTANRARSLQSWQPARREEHSQSAGELSW